MDALEHGNTVEETDEACSRLGLPMAPSVLLQMVGPRVANHVLETMHAAYPDRFPLSPTLDAIADGDGPPVAAGSDPAHGRGDHRAVLEALADEIGRMLDEGVVETVARRRHVPAARRRLPVLPRRHHAAPGRRAACRSGCSGTGWTRRLRQCPHKRLHICHIDRRRMSYALSTARPRG